MKGAFNDVLKRDEYFGNYSRKTKMTDLREVTLSYTSEIKDFDTQYLSWQ